MINQLIPFHFGNGVAGFLWQALLSVLGLLIPSIVDTTTFLADAKNVYGQVQDQISTEAALMNLLDDGSKFGKPINQAGIRGYTFLARLGPNWNMGFRKEGTTGVGTAGQQQLANSTVTLRYAYIPISITGQAENLTKGEQRAFMQARALEAKFDGKDIISHLNVLFAGCERGGELARVAAAPAPAAGAFTADAAGLLPGALFLRVNQPIDAGPVGGGALTINNSVISAINYATRAITHAAGVGVAGNAVTLTGEHPVAPGDWPLTMECLVSLISDTGAIQGLNPATAGQQSWASLVRDVGAVQLSSQLIMEMYQYVKNRGGSAVTCSIFPSAQINQLVAIATQTIRFDVKGETMGKKALDLGFTVFEYGGKPIVEEKDLRADRVYTGNWDMMRKFEAIPLSMANDGAGDWIRLSGSQGLADAIGGIMRWYIQVGLLQRSCFGVYKNFTVPTQFQTAPSTL